MSTLELKELIRRVGSRRFLAHLLAGGVALIAGVALVAPFFVWRYDWGGGTKTALRLLNTHDLASIVAIMEQFDIVLRSGVLYPRWLPDINYGYGVATMVFYPPGLFYLSSLLHAVVKDWVITVFVIAAASTAASGLAFYALSRVFYGRLASAIGALFYIFVPYHALDLYWRGALPEFVGFAFLPVILYFAYKLGTEGRLRYYAGVGLFYGIYLATHLPVGYLFTYALGFYALVWAYKGKNLAIAVRIASGMALGLVLSAIYWLPAALETKDTYEPVTSLFPYDKSYITLQPGSNAFDDLVNSVFSFQALALLVALVVLHLILRNIETGSRDAHTAVKGDTVGPSLGDSKTGPKTAGAALQTGLWKIMAVTATFMSTSFSIYVSKLIPKIQVAVPAWRWLAIASVFTCLLVGAAVERLMGSAQIGALMRWSLRAALSIAIVMNLWLTFGSVILRASANGSYARPNNFVTTGFIPRDAAEPDNLPQTSAVVIEPAAGVFEVTRWDPQHREVAVRVDQPSQLRLKTYYFAGWIARIDGQKAALSRDENGIQLVDVPQGRHVIEVGFVDTAPRIAGKVLFGLGLATIIGLAATDYIRTTKSRIKVADRTSLLSRTNSVMTGAAIVAVIVLGFVIVRWRTSGGGTAVDGNAASGTVASPTETRLVVANWDLIPVAISEKDLDELLGAISTRNSDRVEEMVRTGRAFRAKANSRIRVLKTGYGKLNIRIVEGESITLEGWVPERWVQ